MADDFQNIDDEQVDQVKQNTELAKPVRIAFNV